MPRSRWVFTADEEVARLVRVERTDLGGAHLTVHDEVRDTWEAHEHGRPSPRSGKSGHSYASRGHEKETRRDRFAKQLAAWLEGHADALEIDRVAVFAPPRFLGALRGAWSTRLAACIEEHRGDLAHLPSGDLAAHASIVGLVQARA